MSAQETINITLKVWRQEGPQEPGRFETISAEDVDPAMSFVEMLDALNEKLILEDKEPLAFENVELTQRSYK
jgi:succinate dehydrogenase / fumarate reductase iron-sulfur subunit